ncbi:MAG: hypothetical protein JO328_02530 [Hyphomicrobiales bacterium]|nr:hypothetical protein [Hyphomicrobiales bacterium]
MPEQTEDIQPIVIELGKVGRGQIKDLKAGRGKLLHEVAEALAGVRDKLPDGIEGKRLVPIVFLYRKKSGKRWRRMQFPCW